MLKIGMTGGIGSGKTTVGSLFQALDVPVVDTDHLARKLREPGEPGYQPIVDYFGNQCLDHVGRLKRNWLKQRIFTSTVDKQALEAILHPLVFEAMHAWFEQQSAEYSIAIVPLLFETNSAARFDRTLVIDCPVEQQLKRVTRRDNLNSAEAARIVSSQTNRQNRLQLADDIIVNRHDCLSVLEKDVKKLHNLYLSLSQHSGTLS